MRTGPWVAGNSWFNDSSRKSHQDRDLGFSGFWAFPSRNANSEGYRLILP